MSEKYTTCRCCYQRFPEETTNCPRCSLTNFVILGGEEEREAQYKALAPLVDGHRRNFLKKYDVSVVCYYWKDQDGTIELDTKKRLSLGTAADLLEQVVWLDQEFARNIEDELDLELVVSGNGMEDRFLHATVEPSKEAVLWKLGVEVSKDLQVTVHVNDAAAGAAEPLLDLEH